MKLGDFSNLAKAYSQSRPSYSENVLSLLDKIRNNLVYIKHNRNNHSPSVGSGYIV